MPVARNVLENERNSIGTKRGKIFDIKGYLS
jgi:hypothetical protein